jgi:hypothetical protein
MNRLFDIIFLDETFEFLRNLDKKHYEKIIFNIRKAQTRHDPELFKKLKDEIWEFRTLYQGLHYRLLAFWDKTDPEATLVVSTHCIIKKTRKHLKVKSLKQNKSGHNILKTKKEIKRQINENIYIR